jgi:hypothetical protein
LRLPKALENFSALNWIYFLEEEWFKAIYSLKRFLASIQTLFQLKYALAWQCCWPFFYAKFGKFWKLGRLFFHLKFKKGPWELIKISIQNFSR